MSLDEWTALAILVAMVLITELSYRQGVKHGQDRERDRHRSGDKP